MSCVNPSHSMYVTSPFRGSKNIPTPIAIHRYVGLPVSIIVRRHWDVLRQSSPACYSKNHRQTIEDKPRPTPIHRNIRSPVPIILSWYWYVCEQSSPACRYHSAIRRAQNIPDPISIYCNVYLPVTVIVLWPRRQSSQSRHCQSSIRRAKDKPGTVAVDCNITATITIKINRNWLTKDYKNLAQAERQGIKQTIRPHRQVRDATKWHAESN